MSEITLQEQIRACEIGAGVVFDEAIAAALKSAAATLRALQKKQTCNHGVVVSDGKRWQCLKCEGEGIVP